MNSLGKALKIPNEVIDRHVGNIQFNKTPMRREVHNLLREWNRSQSDSQEAYLSLIRALFSVTITDIEIQVVFGKRCLENYKEREIIYKREVHDKKDDGPVLTDDLIEMIMSLPDKVAVKKIRIRGLGLEEHKICRHFANNDEKPQRAAYDMIIEWLGDQPDDREALQGPTGILKPYCKKIPNKYALVTLKFRYSESVPMEVVMHDEEGRETFHRITYDNSGRIIKIQLRKVDGDYDGYFPALSPSPQ